MREKLIELLNASFEAQYIKRGLLAAPHTADDLIANGVIIKSDCEDCARKTTRIIDKLHGEIAKLTAAHKWIPVTETPKENGIYCVIVENHKSRNFKKRTHARYKNGRWLDLYDNWENKCWDVTHWMPLPEPPKGVCPLTNMATPIAEYGMTNADRIRAMSDEELMQLLFTKISCGHICSFCVPTMRTERKCDGHCRNGVLKWLQQPAEGE